MTRIRTAVAKDAPSIAGLLEQLGYPTSPEEIPSRIGTMESEGGIVIVAVDDLDRVVGVASGSRHATLHAGSHVAYITALVTDIHVRGQGVGRALVEELERWATAHNCTRLAVTSAEHRADAHAFYPRVGLPYTGRRFAKSLASGA